MKILTRIAGVLLLSMLLVCGVCLAGTNDPNPKYYTWVYSNDEVGMFLVNLDPLVEKPNATASMNISQGVMYVFTNGIEFHGRLHIWFDEKAKVFRYEHYDMRFYDKYGNLIRREPSTYDIGIVKPDTPMWKAYVVMWQQYREYIANKCDH
jgi:hypothetical protein